MSEVGPELGIKDRLKSLVGLKPKVTAQAPVSPAPQSSEALKQIIEGKDGLPSPRDFKGPGINTADRIQTGEQIQTTSPGIQDIEAAKAREAGVTMPEIPATKPTYFAQGTELDNQPLASASQAPETPPAAAPEATPDNVIQFPKPTEAPMEKPAA